MFNLQISENISNFFENLKMHFSNFISRFDLSFNRAIELLAYLGIGFFVGFLLSRFGRLFILILVVLAVGTITFDYLGIISIDWNVVRELTGFAPGETVSSIFETYYHWLKSHIAIVLSAFIGFLIGYKIG